MEGTRIDWRFLLTGLYLPNVLLATITGMLNLTVPIYANILGISFAFIGIAAGAVSIGTTLFDVPSSFVFERLGDKKTVIASFSLMTISSLGLVFSNSFYLLVSSLLLFGIGTSMWNLARIYFIASNIPFRFRGRISSFFGATGRIGAVAGPILAGFSVALIGYSMTYAVVTAIVAAAVLGFLSSKRAKVEARIETEDEKAKKASDNGGDGRGEVSREEGPRYGKRTVAAVMLFQILIAMVRNGRYFLMPLFGVTVLHLDPSTVGIIVGISGLFDLFAAYPSGYMLDRFGRAPPTVVAFVLFGSGLLMMALSTNATIFTASVLVIGLGNGLSAGIILTFGADISSQYRGKTRSRFLGVYGLCGDGGNALGPIAMGALSVVTSLIFASVALSMVSFFVAVGLPGLILVRERHASRASASPS